MHVPLVSVEPDSPRRASWLKWVAAGVGASVLIAAVALAVRAGRGEAAGAASPQEASDRWLAALLDEDPVGVINAMAPSEMRTLGRAVRDGLDELSGDTELADQLGELGIEIDVDDLVPGFEATVEDRKVEVTQYSDDVAFVGYESLEIDWEFNPRAFLSAVDVEQLTGGALTNREFIDDVGSSDGTITENDLPMDGDRPFLMAVREGGEWYVSPTYTVLEAVRIENDFPEGDFGEPEGNGSDSPAEAVEAMVEALGSADVGSVITRLPPSRYKAFYAYRDMLDELASDAVDGVEVSATIDEVREFDDEQGIGVQIVSAKVVVVDEFGDETTVTVDGPCITVEEPFADPEEVCLDDLGEEFEPFQDGVPGIDQVWLVVQREDGKFYVDPIGTIISIGAAIDREEFAERLEEIAD
jgi:hypothetical protein